MIDSMNFCFVILQYISQYELKITFFLNLGLIWTSDFCKMATEYVHATCHHQKVFVIYSSHS